MVQGNEKKTTFTTCNDTTSFQSNTISNENLILLLHILFEISSLKVSQENDESSTIASWIEHCANANRNHYRNKSYLTKFDLQIKTIILLNILVTILQTYYDKIMNEILHSNYKYYYFVTYNLQQN